MVVAVEPVVVAVALVAADGKRVDLLLVPLVALPNWSNLAENHPFLFFAQKSDRCIYPKNDAKKVESDFHTWRRSKICVRSE